MTPEPMASFLTLLAEGLRLALEILSVLTVALGLVASLLQLRRRSARAAGALAPLTEIRLSFGGWLSLALEFQLGADIVATTAVPSRDNLIQLGVVAVIRTFLNAFLARELEAEQRLADRR